MLINAEQLKQQEQKDKEGVSGFLQCCRICEWLEDAQYINVYSTVEDTVYSRITVGLEIVYRWRFDVWNIYHFPLHKRVWM